MLHLHASKLKRTDPSQTGGMRRRAARMAKRLARSMEEDLRNWLQSKQGPAIPGTISELFANAEKSDNRKEIEEIIAAALLMGSSSQYPVAVLDANIPSAVPVASLPLFGGDAFATLPAPETWLAEFTDETFRQGLRTAYAGAGGEATGMTEDAFVASVMNRQGTVERVLNVRGIGAEALQGAADRLTSRTAMLVTQAEGGGAAAASVGDMMAELDVVVRTMTDITRIINTEIVRAKAEGVLSGLKNLGYTHVTMGVEFVTANDGAVCPHCNDYSGVVMTIEEAQGLIPLHPNCRCSWIPVRVPVQE